ncbi:uncharacterized protein MELLADRAFT_101620 [Melampsora larici-populina 98AG31]|uniref:Uncharacterized protein n=1 Tax=Melampsora larici-populina (strain 98AG31 / pathotype 3-4-7) TaxID=747676 RepID=F4R6F4_MELLP|nr:uncharacterized protein MELLADRAFT_101620 [Melampsora larici-populina 98AG31]EGG12470.1 hypothetical protein MELLADRAFT_101620 [Melampsora larici-populina 98AG31]
MSQPKSLLIIDKEHETTVLEKREESVQTVGPFPMLGGPEKAGKVFTVTGLRETQSDNVLVHPNRLSLSFIDAQPKLKRRTERIDTDEIDGGRQGVRSNASPQRVLNLLPTSSESTSVNSVEIDKKLVSSTKTKDMLSNLITNESNTHSTRDSIGRNPN